MTVQSIPRKADDMKRIARRGVAAAPPTEKTKVHMSRGSGRFLRHNTIALLALFLALAGTSFAATTMINGRQIKPHTIAKNRLTSKAIKQLRGAQGQRGATGAQGVQGPPGPGAIHLNASVTAPFGPRTVSSFGHWIVELTCNPGSPNALLTVHGPGSVGGTTSIAAGGNPATTYVGTLGPIGSGANVAAVNTGGQVSQTLYLVTGSTLYQLKHLLIASTVGPNVICAVVGDAIPVL